MWRLLIVSVVITSCTPFKIGVLVDTDWIDDDLSAFDDVSSGMEYVTHRVPENNSMKMTNKVCELLNQGYGGFISFLGCFSALSVELQAKSRKIPHIMYTRKPCFLGAQPETFQIIPNCKEVNKALTTIISKLSWLDVFIIHDKTLESRCLQDLVARFSSIAVRSRMLSTSTLSNKQTVTTTKTHNPGIIVLFVDEERVEDILIEAEEQGLLTAKKSWIFIPPDISLPKTINITSQDSRVLFLRQYNKKLNMENDKCLSVLQDNSTMITEILKDAKTIYKKAIHNILAVSPSFTFKPFDCRNHTRIMSAGDKLITEIKKINLKGLSGYLKWDQNKYLSEAELELCSFKGGTDSLHHMGKWTTGNGLQLNDGVLFGNEFTNFGGKVLTVATLQVEPFIYIENNNNVTTYTGFCFDILNEMAKRFNFSYKVVQPPDGQYGGPKEDGTWTGMVGMIMRGEIDIAAAPFTITCIRESVIDFTVPIMEDGVGILTKKITEEPYKLFKTLKPFTLKVWGAIGMVIIVVGIFLYIVNRLSPYTVDGQDLMVDTAHEQKKLKENMWLIYGSFLEQAVDPRPSATSGRVMLGFWWVFTILMLASYTANLAAYLTVSITVQPINSLSELITQDKIKPLVKTGTSLHTLFQTASSGVYTQVWEKMSTMPYVTSRATAVELARTGEYAFMTDISQLEFIQLQDCEAFALAAEVFNQAGLGFVMPENAPYKEAFNLNIMKMHEAGMTERWKDKWWPKINTCSTVSRTGGANSLGMDSIAGVFLVYVSVVGVAIITFLLNLFWQKCIFKRYKIYLAPIKNQMWGRSMKYRETTDIKNKCHKQ
ncbi:glutamate receptor ionotropic, delta-1-like [Mytilus trossulus]|uniref:glutamate receptor ionotropic, delta-1-like n=1 Tax=Mytilus trossulus TaxID=6551 RepID=UPI003004840A